MQEQITQKVLFINPDLKFVDRLDHTAARFGAAFVSPLCINTVASFIASAFPEGIIAWDQLVDDGQFTTVIVRSAQ